LALGVPSLNPDLKCFYELVYYAANLKLELEPGLSSLLERVLIFYDGLVDSTILIVDLNPI